MDENEAGDNLRELWKKGLPPEVEKELKKSKALLPTLECLQPHELLALGNEDKRLEITGKQLLERIRHVVRCQFCRGLISRHGLDSVITKKKTDRKGNKKNR